jgi:hypothetical protein
VFVVPAGGAYVKMIFHWHIFYVLNNFKFFLCHKKVVQY